MMLLAVVNTLYMCVLALVVFLFYTQGIPLSWNRCQVTLGLPMLLFSKAMSPYHTGPPQRHRWLKAMSYSIIDTAVCNTCRHLDWHECEDIFVGPVVYFPAIPDTDHGGCLIIPLRSICGGWEVSRRRAVLAVMRLFSCLPCLHG